MDEPSDIDPKLLEILVCPLTKGPLRYDRAAQELISEEAGLAYPIRDGIPIMLVDEARTLREDEIQNLIQRAGRVDASEQVAHAFGDASTALTLMHAPL